MRDHSPRDLRHAGWFLAGSLAAAITAAPVLYQAVRAMSEVARDREADDLTGHFVRWADQMVFSDVLVCVWLASCLMLLPGLLARLSSGCLVTLGAACLRFDRRGWSCGLSGGLVVAAGGMITARGTGQSFGFSARSMIVAFAGVVPVEWMIRGWLFDLLRRAHSPRAALVASASVFAIIGNLIAPSVTCVGDDESWWLGWERVWQLVTRGGVDVAALFTLGILLGSVRATTASIWPGVLIHLIWVGVLTLTAQPSSGAVAWASLSAGILWWIVVRSNHVRSDAR